MFLVPEPKPTSLVVAFKQQRERLGLLLQDVADRAGVSDQTVLAIVNRTTPPTLRQLKNERKVEGAVEWATGSFQAIREGSEPTPIEAARETENPFENVDDLEEAIMNRNDLSEEGKQTLLNVYRAYRDKT